jgi:UDP-galactopyranose mutase
MIEVQCLVIGAGPSGLAAAYALRGDTLVLEKQSRIGGLCRSITHRGGTFDIGGHSFHTPHPEVYQLVQRLVKGGLFEQQRDARVFSCGTLIPYPFQKSYHRLPDPEVVRACEEGLRSVGGDGARPRNFEEYIGQKFGQGIADHFMLPYNRKLWARDISRISCEWTSERVAGAAGTAERFETTGGQRKPLQPDTVVGYPRTGGFEEVYRSFLPHLPPVRLNREIVHIDPIERTATTADGSSYRWEFLVSTMPLPILAQVVSGTPDDVKEAAERLEYMSLRVELLLTGRPLDTPIQRIYVADADVPPHKIALNHNSSDHLRAQPRHAIMAEVSLSPEKHIDVSQIVQKTISFLCDTDILDSRSDVIWSGHIDVKYAYPVYTHDRPALVAEIKGWMRRHDIYTLGRFGDWSYVNSDKCVFRGLELGGELREQFPAVSSIDHLSRMASA